MVGFTSRCCFVLQTSKIRITNQLWRNSNPEKNRFQMMLDDSKDEVIKSLKPTLKTGKKWKVRDTIRSAKDNLAFEEIWETRFLN